MLRPRLTVAALAALPALAAPAAAPAMPSDPAGPSVPILTAGYGLKRIDVLAGDTVTWRNQSFRPHTVTASDESFTSAELGGGGTYARRFDAAGTVAYYCRLHTFMRGEVDVHRLLLDAPHDAGAPGRPLVLGGRAAVAAGGVVSIEADEGTGFTPVAHATVGADGRFSATVTPRATTRFRAVEGGDASPPVEAKVMDRKVAASVSRHGRRVVVNAAVRPASPGATVVLQLRLRERFGWWPVRKARLDHHSKARFSLRLARSVPARVVLTRADGATPLARSGTFRVGPR